MTVNRDTALISLSSLYLPKLLHQYWSIAVDLSMILVRRELN